MVRVAREYDMKRCSEPLIYTEGKFWEVYYYYFFFLNPVCSVCTTILHINVWSDITSSIILLISMSCTGSS